MRGKYGEKYHRDERHFAHEHSHEEHPHRGGGHKRKDHPRGAKTFRRGRALEFLSRMNVRRATLKQQLESPELQSINPILVGELKAVEMIIDEFTLLFEIHQDEIKQNDAAENEKDESGKASSED